MKRLSTEGVENIDQVVEALLRGERSNPLRGLKCADMGMDFVMRYEAGSLLSSQEIDAFFRKWVGHFDGDDPNVWISTYDPKDRGEWVGDLRKATTHKRLREKGYPTVTIRSDKKGAWKVIAIDSALRDRLIPSELERYAQNKARELRYLIEAVDLSHLPDATATYLRSAAIQQIEEMEDRIWLAGRTAQRAERMARSMGSASRQPGLPAAEDCSE